MGCIYLYLPLIPASGTTFLIWNILLRYTSLYVSLQHCCYELTWTQWVQVSTMQLPWHQNDSGPSTIILTGVWLVPHEIYTYHCSICMSIYLWLTTVIPPWNIGKYIFDANNTLAEQYKRKYLVNSQNQFWNLTVSSSLPELIEVEWSIYESLN